MRAFLTKHTGGLNHTQRSIDRIHGLQMPMALWLLLFAAAVPSGYTLYLAAAGGETELLIVFVVILAVLMLCMGLVCCFRIRIDEAGVSSFEAMRRKRILWSEVCSVHIVRLVNGWRMIYVSRSHHAPLLPPYPRHPQVHARVNAYLAQTVCMGFTRKRLQCIRRYWQGEIGE